MATIGYKAVPSIALPFVPMTEEELAKDRARSLSPIDFQLLPPNASGDIASLDLQPMYCQWNDCTEGFWELEDIVEHLQNVHVNNQDGKKPTCEWNDCPRKGLPQASKFAITAHLRAHTGERPFICPHPECDISLNRADTLQKHIRAAHSDLEADEKPLARKRKLYDYLAQGLPASIHNKTLDSSLAEYSPANPLVAQARIPHVSLDHHDTTPLQLSIFPLESEHGQPEFSNGQDTERDSREMTNALRENTYHLPDEVRYLCMLARYDYAIQQKKTLFAELKHLSASKGVLEGHKDGMVDVILRKEIGDQAVALLQQPNEHDINRHEWSFARRTALPQLGTRQTKEEADGKSQHGKDDEDGDVF